MSIQGTYGVSLYELALDEGIEKEILGDLKKLVALFKENPLYTRLLDLPSITQNETNKIIDEDFGIHINKYTLNFLKLLAEKRMVRHIDECAKVYESLYNKDNNIVVVTATTARELSNELKEKLVKTLETKLKSRVTLKTRVDKECIGGIIIEADGMRINSSIKSGLENLKKALI